MRRATFYLVAAAARGSEPVRKQLAAEVQRAISAADALAAAGSGGGRSAPTPRSAANDWEMQHTVFAATRLSGGASGGDEISRSFMVGVGSPDPVGARHALALGAEVAYRVRCRCWCCQCLFCWCCPAGRAAGAAAGAALGG